MPVTVCGGPDDRDGSDAHLSFDREEELTAFFAERRPAAVLKHGILRRYLRVFASKTGSTAPGGRVAYLDGYSGPGEYEDGTPGSPMLAAETAEILSTIRELEGFYVERDHATFERLRDTLSSTGHRCTLYEGEVEGSLPRIMNAVGDAPLFAFFDPFGLGISFDALTHHVLGRKRGRSGPATEVLLNFSLPGLRRNAGHLTSGSTDPRYVKARPRLVARVDRMLGGDWWHQLWRGRIGGREGLILRGYVERLRKAAGGWGSMVVPVSNRWDGPPVYCLVFLTSYRGGLWVFNEVLSNAMEEYRQYVHEFHGMLDLEPLPDREARWIGHIAENIMRTCEAASFIIGDRIPEVLGDALGLAREKHIRRALKRLCEEGAIQTEVFEQGRVKTDARGSVERMRVMRA